MVISIGECSYSTKAAMKTADQKPHHPQNITTTTTTMTTNEQNNNNDDDNNDDDNNDNNSPPPPPQSNKIKPNPAMTNQINIRITPKHQR